MIWEPPLGLLIHEYLYSQPQILSAAYSTVTHSLHSRDHPQGKVAHLHRPCIPLIQAAAFNHATDAGSQNVTRHNCFLLRESERPHDAPRKDPFPRLISSPTSHFLTRYNSSPLAAPPHSHSRRSIQWPLTAASCSASSFLQPRYRQPY
jgi:hypothetical protein